MDRLIVNWESMYIGALLGQTSAIIKVSQLKNKNYTI